MIPRIIKRSSRIGGSVTALSMRSWEKMELKKSYSHELESIRFGQEEDQWRVWISRWIGD